jgi:hypothetical protein
MLGSILLSPFKGLSFVFNEIAKAVDEDREARRKQTMAELQELHRNYEKGAIAEEAFDEQEKILLDRLDALSDGGGA